MTSARKSFCPQFYFLNLLDFSSKSFHMKNQAFSLFHLGCKDGIHLIRCVSSMSASELIAWTLLTVRERNSLSLVYLSSTGQMSGMFSVHISLEFLLYESR